MIVGIADLEFRHVQWRKSSYSNGSGGECVEVGAPPSCGGTLVRDSKNPHGPVLAFPAEAWTSFVAGLAASLSRSRAGMADLDGTD